MAIYFNPNLITFAKLLGVSDDLVKNFASSEELEYLQRLAEDFGYELEFLQLTNGSVITFGENLAASTAYYEDTLIPIDEFSQYRVTKDREEEVTRAFRRFLHELEPQFDWVKGLTWHPTGVYLLAHS